VGTALVTGASSGIGRELARLFAADGHDLVLVARREERLEELSRELSAPGRVRAWTVPSDLTAPGGVAGLVAEVATLGVEVEYLVNAAGVGTTGPFAESDVEREASIIDLNVTALVRLTRALLPGMLARRRGFILNLGSTAGFQPGPYIATYYASKAFVNHFSEALAEELSGSGVSVTLSCPGPTTTEFGDISGMKRSRLFGLGVAPTKAVAKAAYRALLARRVLVVHGWKNRLGVLLVRLGPRSWVRAVVSMLNRPPRGAS